MCGQHMDDYPLLPLHLLPFPFLIAMHTLGLLTCSFVFAPYTSPANMPDPIRIQARLAGSIGQKQTG